jgi:hypothetical protein
MVELIGAGRMASGRISWSRRWSGVGKWHQGFCWAFLFGVGFVGHVVPISGVQKSRPRLKKSYPELKKSGTNLWAGRTNLGRTCSCCYNSVQLLISH